MWLGVVLAVLAVFLLLPRSPTLGAAVAVASATLALIGAWFKKRHCPKCREGVCEVEGLPPSPETPSPPNPLSHAGERGSSNHVDTLENGAARSINLLWCRNSHVPAPKRL
jgi:hypothetical protein